MLGQPSLERCSQAFCPIVLGKYALSVFSTFCQDLDVSLIEYDCLNKWGNRYDRLDMTFSEPFQPFDLSVLNMQPTAVGKSWLHNTEIFLRLKSP